MLTKEQETYYDILTVFEKRSTCARIQVAAVFVKNDRIISTGWNGTISGGVHCKDHFCNHTHEQMLAEHHEFALNNELHAEMNGIAYAAAEGLSIRGADLYVTYSPCLVCAHMLAASKVKQVFYKTLYDRYPQGLEYLRDHGIPVTQLIDHRSKNGHC